jgi:hypothetical protein
VEALALGTFGRNNVIRVYSNRGIALTGVNHGAVNQGKAAFHIRAISDGPFHSAFINCVVGALRFAGPAVNAFFCDLYRHNFSLLVSDLVLQQK